MQVSVGNLPAVQAVSGTFFQATQPVSGSFFQTTQPVSFTTPATYSVVTTPFTPATSATDVFAITGSATKTVKITRIFMSASQTTGGQFTVTAVKRSTADSAGTAVTDTAISYDSSNASPTAVCKHYTANPTLGTTVGSIKNSKVFIGTSTTAVEDVIAWDFTPTMRQAVTLRGTSEQLVINFGAATLTGGSVDITVEFTEE